MEVNTPTLTLTVLMPFTLSLYIPITTNNWPRLTDKSNSIAFGSRLVTFLNTVQPLHQRLAANVLTRVKYDAVRVQSDTICFQSHTATACTIGHNEQSNGQT